MIQKIKLILKYSIYLTALVASLELFLKLTDKPTSPDA